MSRWLSIWALAIGCAAKPAPRSTGARSSSDWMPAPEVFQDHEAPRPPPTPPPIRAADPPRNGIPAAHRPVRDLPWHRCPSGEGLPWGTLAGWTYDGATDRPFPVRIVARPKAGPDVVIASDRDGDYAIDVAPGEYQLRFVEGTHCLLETEVCVRSGRSASMNVRLDRTKAGPTTDVCGDTLRQARFRSYSPQDEGDFPWIRRRGSDVLPSP